MSGNGLLVSSELYGGLQLAQQTSNTYPDATDPNKSLLLARSQAHPELGENSSHISEP